MQRLTMLLWNPWKNTEGVVIDGGCSFMDSMVDDAVTERIALAHDIAKKVQDRQLVFVKWGEKHNDVRLYLVSTGKTYHGAQAQQIMRRAYRLDVGGYPGIPDLTLDDTPRKSKKTSWEPDAVLSAERLAEAERLSSTETDRKPVVVNQALTEAERKASQMLAEVWNIFVREIVGKEDTADEDQREFMVHIHNAQRMIMSNAAGRAYPDEFRLLGGTVGSDQ